MDIGQANMFIEAQKHPISASAGTRARCIDDRYGRENKLNPCARPGADAGFFLCVVRGVRELLGHGNETDIRAVWDAVLESTGGEKEFHFHTDSDNASCTHSGCGHILNAKKTPTEYGVTAGDVQFLTDQLTDFKEKGMGPCILTGQHKASAVFVIHSSTHSLYPLNSRVQAFIFSRTLNENRLWNIALKLSSYMNRVKRGTTFTELTAALKSASDRNLAITLGRLATNLPIFHAYIAESGKSRVILNS